MTTANLVDSGGGGDWWTENQERLEEEVPGAEGSDLESVTLESDGTSGDFQVTDMTLSDEYTPVDQAQTEWHRLGAGEKAILAATLALAVGSAYVWMEGDA